MATKQAGKTRGQKSKVTKAKTAKAKAAGKTELLDAKKLSEDIGQVRDRFIQKFAQVTISLMGVPRYASQPISDLQRLIMAPLIRYRIAIAMFKGKEDDRPGEMMAGIAIWASVSDETDARIREQVKAGVFPVQLQGDDWRSGDTLWLLDVIAPSEKLAAAVISNFSQVTKGGQINLHPIITKMVDKDLLEKMGAEKVS
ncbi:MAG: toxin-activating lysine-acyltransferase [Pseudomonadota bacterium]